MRPIICDVCGKMMRRETAFDEDGHTTDDGYVNVVKMETADNDAGRSDFHLTEDDIPGVYMGF